MRAVICKIFKGYSLEAVDELSMERVIELYASAEWLSEEEKRQLPKTSRRRR